LQGEMKLLKIENSDYLTFVDHCLNGDLLNPYKSSRKEIHDAT